MWVLILGVSLLVVSGLVLMPGVAATTMSLLDRGVAGGRFVIYDREVFCFGFNVSITTAQWLSFCLGPIAAISGVLFIRAWWKRTTNAA